LWSIKYDWQSRIAFAATARSDALLNEASELDADTFLITSRHLHKQVNDFSSYPDTVIKIRESVRKPIPKGGAHVSVNVSVEIRQLAEKLAKEIGVDASDLIREAEALAQREWEKV